MKVGSAYLLVFVNYIWLGIGICDTLAESIYNAGIVCPESANGVGTQRGCDGQII